MTTELPTDDRTNDDMATVDGRLLMSQRDPTSTPRHPHVIAALAAVEAEVGGIEKRRGGDGGVNYAFRGIDRIAAAAQPLLGKHGVVIVPELREQSVRDFTVNNKPWTETFVEVQWKIYGPGGLDDHIVAYTSGQGRDNSDKGINKAMTGAFKNLLLRILCIGDPADDTDGHTHESDPVGGAPAKDPRVTRVFNALTHLTEKQQADAKALAASYNLKLTEANLASSTDFLEVIEAFVRNLDDAPGDVSPPDDAPERPLDEVGNDDDGPPEPEEGTPPSTPNSPTDGRPADPTPAEIAAERRRQAADKARDKVKEQTEEIRARNEETDK